MQGNNIYWQEYIWVFLGGEGLAAYTPRNNYFTYQENSADENGILNSAKTASKPVHKTDLATDKIDSPG